jgi:hypothetical protein
MSIDLKTGLKLLFGSLFVKNDPKKIKQMMEVGNIGILSARCCNPAAVAMDEELIQNVKEAMGKTSTELEINFETITTAQKSLRSLAGKLNDSQNTLVDKITSLFQVKGLSMFPVLLINGELAFYGGVPTIEMIQEKLVAMEKKL